MVSQELELIGCSVWVLMLMLAPYLLEEDEIGMHNFDRLFDVMENKSGITEREAFVDIVGEDSERFGGVFGLSGFHRWAYGLASIMRAEGGREERNQSSDRPPICAGGFFPTTPASPLTPANASASYPVAR